jgi:cyclophilin family peptidyl-prolyl cis-trans isomerase
MAQFGISPDPKVTAAWNGQNLRDDPVKESNKRGFLTFATAGPNTRTTQLFISTGDNSFLDPQGFSPFGEVIEGMDLVDKFYDGYGLNPDSGSIQQLGRPWVVKNMPKVDSIKTAVIVPLTPPATKAPATKATTTKQ